MANELPEFLQLDPEGIHYQNGLIRADIDTGFSVSGKTIVEAPDQDKEPLLYEGASRLYRAGVVVEASQVEFDEQQESAKINIGGGKTLDLKEVAAEVLIKSLSEGRFVLGATSVNAPTEKDRKYAGQLQPGEEVEDEDLDEDYRLADDEEAEEAGRNEDGTPVVYDPADRTSSFSIPGYSEPGPKTRKKRQGAQEEVVRGRKKRVREGGEPPTGQGAAPGKEPNETSQSEKKSGGKVT